MSQHSRAEFKANLIHKVSSMAARTPVSEKKKKKTARRNEMVGEPAQQLKGGLPEKSSLFPRTHVRWLSSLCYSSPSGSDVIFWPLGICTHMAYTHTNTCVYIDNKYKYIFKWKKSSCTSID
jgi:hypothetical protein